MRKISFFLIAFILITINLAAQKGNNLIDKVIWIVGDEAILKSDVENEILASEINRTPIEGNPYCIIPEQIAIQKLYLHQAAIDSIQVNQNYVNQMADRIINNYISNVGSVEKLEEYQHKTIAKIREEMRARLSDQSLTQQMQAELTENIQATPAEVRRYFGNINQDSLPTVPPQVELQLLSVRPPIPLTEINRIKERLREFTERANKNPEDFSLLARLYSEDKASAMQGGELGFQGRGIYDPEFATVAFSMNDPKKVSRIVESEFGFHIIQFIERRGDKVNCRHILLKPKASLQDEKKGMERLDSLANLIRENKITFEQAVMNYSQDKNTRMNAGLMMRENQYAQELTSKFEYKDLPQEVAAVAYNMNVGEVSKAFTMVDQLTGNEMIAIIKLKSKIPTHKANLKDDYQMLKTILEEKKKSDFLNAWITKKQKEIYISIDPEYRNCDFQYKGWVKN